MNTTLVDEFDLDIQLGPVDFIEIEAATVRTSGRASTEGVCCTDYCCTTL
ncbi:hypothetical protein GCM10009745_57210 [Kribbella yunnanensis]|uniref:FxLD family lantipeptide n=1 Tax=Kribbella yunnanensis TaxID=190194 RepID=A0ABP4UBK3_9ACTN